jgi:hypothetical protein
MEDRKKKREEDKENKPDDKDKEKDDADLLKIKVRKSDHKEVVEHVELTMRLGIIECLDSKNEKIYIALRGTDSNHKQQQYTMSSDDVFFHGFGKPKRFSSSSKDDTITIEIKRQGFASFEAFQVFLGPKGERIRVDLDDMERSKVPEK